MLVTAEEKRHLFEHGRVVFREAASAFAVFEGADSLLVQFGVDPRRWQVLPKHLLGSLTLVDIFPDIFAPVLHADSVEIGRRPADDEDVEFWQFPCSTERQAYENHSALPTPSPDAQHGDRLNIYVPLPWATYIDRRTFPAATLHRVRRHLIAAHEIARINGQSVRAHTVCQHVDWRLILEEAADLGISDIWSSHCTADAQAKVRESGLGLRVHPWSLYAVNYCEPERRDGLEVGRPMAERRLLASFIGAHMRHYLSDIRVRLWRQLSALNREDILVDLGDEWHFHKTVYDYQVRRRALEDSHLDDIRSSAYRYNRVLSDSRFSLCPEGAGPNTLRFWESIAVGSIPVLFNDDLLWPRDFAEDLGALCIQWKGRPLGSDLVDFLARFGLEDLQSRSDRLQQIYREIEKMTCF